MDNPKNSQPTAPRVIAMSDFPPINVIPGSTFKEGEPREMYSDPDDVQSMIRLLLYANELEIEGLVASAGSLANIARKKNILDVLDVYERVQPNLAKRDPRYPMADALRAVTWQGLDGAWGTPYFGRPGLPLDELIGEEKDTEASEAIIRVVDKPDPQPVWVCVWGGSCEVAQAIWKVQRIETKVGRLISIRSATQSALPASINRTVTVNGQSNSIQMETNMREPNYKLGWFIPNQIAALTHFHADVTAEDFAGVVQTGTELLQDVDHSFHIIIDNRAVEMSQPVSLSQMQQMVTYMNHPLLRWVVVIQPKTLPIDTNSLPVETEGTTQLKNVASLQGAIDFLREADKEIHWDQADSTFFPNGTFV